jgi:drug/metabolite transporter (DMT)-like permease
LYILAAAVLWSLSGAFVKLLRPPATIGGGVIPASTLASLGLGQPPVPELVIAFYRCLFAGLVLIPTLRRADLSFRPLMLVMALCFAIMNALFVSALGRGTAANAILLQYTAPLWMYLASVWILREPTNRRNTVALLVALCGVAVIVVAAWHQSELQVVLIALGSGVAYAGVVLCLRVLRDASPRWLTVWNHLLAAFALLPLLWLHATPRPSQLLCLALFGAVQMALPYWLMSRGLKSVNPQEAGTITLIEPLLNPVWAYLVAGDTPETATVLGGSLILLALVWRYFPTSGTRVAT